MAEIWIWNSMARRRRSASDTFEENGVQIIKSFLTSKGHQVKTFDWATDRDYNSLSPGFLRSFNRVITEKLMDHRRSSITKLLLEPVGPRLQKILSYIQGLRLARKLRYLALESRKNHIKVMGIKVWYGEAFSWSKYLAKQVNKVNPDCIVIAGGYHVSLYEEDILKNSTFDLAISHEGEYTLWEMLEMVDENSKNDSQWCKSKMLSLFRAAASKKILQGLIYRDNGSIKKVQRTVDKKQIELEKAIPAYSKENGKTKVHILMESLGCPWGKCHFCVHNQFNPIYQTRQLDAILNEIEIILKQGIGLFRFTGSDTTYTHGKEIADSILKRGLKIEFSMGARAVRNSSDSGIFKNLVEAYVTMIKAGLRGVFIGGECGNEIINQKVMNKGVKRIDIIQTIKAIRKAEKITNIPITISLAFIYPTPLIDGIDDEQVADENLSLLAVTKPDSAVISPPGPFKKSTWFEQKDRFGFELSADFIQQFMEYEYVLYKPLQSWPELDISLHGKKFKQLLVQSQQLQMTVESKLGIPCNLCDEHFLMMRAAKINTKDEILKFKRKSQVSIVSSDYTYLQYISEKVNAYSSSVAALNKFI